MNDLGDRTIVRGEFLRGTPEIRRETVEIGPISHSTFRYLGASSMTNSDGVLSGQVRGGDATIRRPQEAICQDSF